MTEILYPLGGAGRGTSWCVRKVELPQTSVPKRTEHTFKLTALIRCKQKQKDSCGHHNQTLVVAIKYVDIAATTKN